MDNDADIKIIKINTGKNDNITTINNITVKTVNQNFSNANKIEIKHMQKENENHEKENNNNELNLNCDKTKQCDNEIKEEPKEENKVIHQVPKKKLRAQRTKAPKKYMEEKRKKEAKKGFMGIFKCCLPSGNDDEDE